MGIHPSGDDKPAKTELNLKQPTQLCAAWTVTKPRKRSVNRRARR